MKKFASAANFVLAASPSSDSPYRDRPARLILLVLTPMNSFSLDGNFFTLSEVRAEFSVYDGQPAPQGHPAGAGVKSIYTSQVGQGEEVIVLLAASPTFTFDPNDTNSLCAVAATLAHESCRVLGEFCTWNYEVSPGEMGAMRAIQEKKGVENTIKAYELQMVVYQRCPTLTQRQKLLILRAIQKELDKNWKPRLLLLCEIIEGRK